MIRKITAAGNFFIRAVTTVLAVIFFLYGILMLWDMFRTEMKAFASYDLMKYRPNIEENEPPYLDDLVKINADTAAWLTIYDTNIDYPVMQGKDDMEYLNRDVYKKFSMSGSIFMASKDSKDFSDPYTLVYGHHMENGSMFGDILKFKKKTFFDKNDTGVLIMPEKVYDLKIIACIETDAYDHNVYRSDKAESELPSFLEYCKTKSTSYRREPYEKLLALSTCDNATTSGRTVLICAMTTRTDPLPDREYGKPIPHREPVGHPMAGAYWALINLLVLLTTVYFTLNLLWLRRKELKGIYREKTFILETLVTIVSVVMFILTEDLHKPIQMTDRWTPVMIALLFAGWLIKKRKEKANENHEHQ